MCNWGIYCGNQWARKKKEKIVCDLYVSSYSLEWGQCSVLEIQKIQFAAHDSAQETISNIVEAEKNLLEDRTCAKVSPTLRVSVGLYTEFRTSKET